MGHHDSLEAEARTCLTTEPYNRYDNNSQTLNRVPHHQGLIHVVLSPGAAVIVLCVHSEAEEKGVDHILIHREEAVGHEEGEQAGDKEG